MESETKINPEMINSQMPGERTEEEKEALVDNGNIGRETPEVLGGQKIDGKTKEFADSFFREFLSGSENVGYFRACEVQEKLNKIIGEANNGEEREEGVYDAKFREATKVFLEEMLKFCRENRDNENFEQFCHSISESLFSGSPDISTPLELEDSFDFAAKATRMPEIQGTIGARTVGELVYKINFDYNPGGKENDVLLENFNKSSVSEKLDKLHLIENLIAQSMANGDAFYDGQKKLEKLIEDIKGGDKNFFVGCYLDVIKERVASEKENPTQSVIKRAGDPSYARLADSLSKEEVEESERLGKEIYPSKKFKAGEKIAQVGEDAVAILNHSNVPVEFARVDMESLGEEFPISGADLVKVKDILREEQEGGKEEVIFENLITYVNKKILKPYHKIEGDDFGALAKEWNEIDDKIPKEKWQEYFELERKIESLREDVVKYRSDKIIEAEKKNLEKSRQFIAYFKENASTILNKRGHEPEELKRIYEEFKKAHEEGDQERAFSLASDFTRALKYFPEPEPIVGDFRKEAEKDPSREPKKDDGKSESIKLMEQYGDMKNIHSHSFENSQKEADEYRTGQFRAHHEDISRFGAAKMTIVSGKSEILSGLQKEINKIDAEAKEKMTEAEFIPYDEMAEKYDKGFFRHMDPEETELLLEHLHRPKMREYVESKLGIDLKEIPLRYQVYLLEFLSNKPEEEVGNIEKFLGQAKDQDAKINRIKSFLSLESGEELGKDILNIGEKLDPESADAIFAKYSEIASQTEKSREDLEDMFKERKNISDEEKEKIVQDLINKSSRILIDFSKEIDQGGNIEKDKVLKELDGYKADMILTASVYKGIDKNNDVSFEDLKGVSFEQKNADNFSEPEISEMIEIYKKNYEGKPKLQAKIVEDFKNILESKNGNTEIYLFKKDGKIVAFNRFDQKEEGKKYFGSYNVSPALRGSEIGASLLQASLDKEAQDNEIEADCIPDTLISARYIGGKCGFVVRKLDTNYKGTGVPLFNIEKKDENKKYHYFNYSDEQVVDEYSRDNPDNKYSEDSIRFILKFDPKANDFIKTADKLINNSRYVISNYVFGKDGKEVYCAFEKA